MRQPLPRVEFEFKLDANSLQRELIGWPFSNFSASAATDNGAYYFFFVRRLDLSFFFASRRILLRSIDLSEENIQI